VTSKTLHTACIGLGSNLGESKALLAAAWKQLGTRPPVKLQRLSSPYKTPPFDMDSPHWFVNAVGLLQTNLPPHELLALLLEVEKEFGRIRNQAVTGHQDRTLDLDLLLYDDVVLQTDNLVLPHPQIEKRLFVLLPLLEIAPEIIHPVQKINVSAMIDKLGGGDQQGEIVKMRWG